jgi:TldD protein
MKNNLKIAKNNLLVPAGLKESHLQQVLDSILTSSIDYADLYFQSSHSESWALEEGIVKHGNHGIERGVGVRAISGEKVGFAYSDDIELSALTNAAKAVKSISHQGVDKKVQRIREASGLNLYSSIDPLNTLSEVEKISLLQRVDREARKQDPRVSQVMVSLAGVYETILIFASDGTLAADVRPLVRFNVSVIVEDKDKTEHGSCGGGARASYDYFFIEDRALNYAREAVRQALVNLDAIDTPAGVMPVVLGPGWPGVLLHEAIGHGLEGDFNRKGTSMYAGRIGEKVASEYCTIVDDGTLKNRRGSLNIDDEGVSSQHTVLIEDGILKGYMQDKMNARLMKVQSTGNARRESYAHLPIPRMTNTYMLPGSYDPKEVIASVDKGLYAVNFSGGQVDITSGKFVFSTSEAYLIENGKITQPVKNATLIGNGTDVLTKISMVGNDLQLDSGVGVCGKEGQSVPVGVGQPTLKIDEITVGGTG